MKEWGVWFRNLGGPAWKLESKAGRQWKGRQLYFRQCHPLKVVENSHRSLVKKSLFKARLCRLFGKWNLGTKTHWQNIPDEQADNCIVRSHEQKKWGRKAGRWTFLARVHLQLFYKNTFEMSQYEMSPWWENLTWNDCFIQNMWKLPFLWAKRPWLIAGNCMVWP